MIRRRIKNIITLCLVVTLIFSSAGNVFASPVLGERILKLGSRGQDVQQLQTKLKGLGFFKYGTVTTYFGSITKNAVIGFQKKHGLIVDGIVGPQTIGKLKQVSGNPSVSPVSRSGGVTPSYYTVQAGDSLWELSVKFGTSISEIIRINNLKSDRIYVGQKLLVSKQAGQTQPTDTATNPSKVGKLVDWWSEGRYLLKPGNIFTIVDIGTGKQLRVRMLGGLNHSDVEPYTVQDTNVMKSLFGNWTWNPRPVVIFKDGMNIAASLSGMPHSIDRTPNNGVNGHFDLYLHNSKQHSSNVSPSYVKKHQDNVLRAAGKL